MQIVLSLLAFPVWVAASMMMYFPPPLSCPVLWLSVPHSKPFSLNSTLSPSWLLYKHSSFQFQQALTYCSPSVSNQSKLTLFSISTSLLIFFFTFLAGTVSLQQTRIYQKMIKIMRKGRKGFQNIYLLNY